MRSFSVGIPIKRLYMDRAFARFDCMMYPQVQPYTCCRLMNKVRAKTTSTRAGFRLLLVDLTFFLSNMWVDLKWCLCLAARHWHTRPVPFPCNLFRHFVNTVTNLYDTVAYVKL